MKLCAHLPKTCYTDAETAAFKSQELKRAKKLVMSNSNFVASCTQLFANVICLSFALFSSPVVFTLVIAKSSFLHNCLILKVFLRCLLPAGNVPWFFVYISSQVVENG